MIRWLATVCLMIGTAVQSDPLGANDYSKMFEHYADQLVTDVGGARVLEWPDGVTIYESIVDQERFYAGVDFDEGGPIGCLVSFYAEVLGFVEVCPAHAPTPNPDHRSRLLTFYAQNAFPPADTSDLNTRFDTLVAQNRDQITQCYPNGDMVEYAETLLGVGAEALFETALAKPRLPVMQPCL